MENPTTIDLILDFFGRLPGWLVFGFFWYKIFNIKNARVYWAAWALQLMLTTTFALIKWAMWPRLLIDIGNLVLFPLVASHGHGKLPYRLLVIATTSAAMILSEMVTSAVTSSLGVIDNLENFRNVLDHPLAYYSLQGLLALIFALLCSLLYPLLRRLGKESVDLVCLYFGAFLFSQLVLFCTVLAVAERVAWGDPAVMSVSFGFALVSLAIDAVVLLAAGHINEAANQQRKNAVLREQLESCLDHYRDVVAEEERVARFRHDLRGELQAVDALVGRGQYDRALGLVDELQAALDAPATNPARTADATSPTGPTPAANAADGRR